MDQTRRHPDGIGINEIAGMTERAGNWIEPAWDSRGNMGSGLRLVGSYGRRR